jgi:3-oxoacyl-[acyl-carrier-protein] synthase II
MTSERIPEGRDVKTCFCPYDRDAGGTFCGNGGSAMIVTTAEFAMKHGLDITSVFLGWGTSAESGVPEHTSGVGYGGANAMILALEMAYRNFGVGVRRITRFNAHGTSTAVNSKTDLLTAVQAMLIRTVMERDGRLPDDLDLDRLYAENKNSLPRNLKLAASKAAGHAHPIGPCGIISAGDGTYYLRGEKGVGVPNFRRLPDKVGDEASHFDISAKPMDGNEEGVEMIAVQGFGGPNGVIVRGSANEEFLASLAVRGRNQERIRDAYFEKAADIRSRRLAREAWEMRQRGWALRSAVENRWPDVIKL